MKRLHAQSQNFLRSPRLVKELVGHTNIKPRDTVYDIGAGSGVISSVLATRCQAVVAIEADPQTSMKLRANMTQYDNVRVEQRDFLTMSLPKSSYKVFSNIPFHLSSPILRKLTEADNPPEATYLIVQKQFANKLLADGKHFTGQLGMMIGPLFHVRVRKRLQRTDFWPHPNVDTALLEILPRDKPLLKRADMNEYRQFTVDCFSDPKKFARTPQKAAGLRTGVKPSEMTVEQWVGLFLLTKS